jgi:hypothetical protein
MRTQPNRGTAGGLGQPQEHVLRQTVVARRLATAAGPPDDQQAAVFYVSLLTAIQVIVW